MQGNPAMYQTKMKSADLAALGQKKAGETNRNRTNQTEVRWTFFQKKNEGDKTNMSGTKFFEQNTGIWHEISMNETKKRFRTQRHTGQKNDGPQRDHSIQSLFLQGGWLAPHRSGPLPCFPSFFCQTPSSTRWSGARRPSTGKLPSTDISAHLWTSVQWFEVWVHVVFVPFADPFLSFCVFSSICLFMLSRTSVYCPT